jgi:mannose-6-phosphate isomerase-like protein (cupin superfamily)
MKREEFLIQTDNVRVRVMELLPGDATPWHFHQEVVDHLVGLTGVILVRLKQPEVMVELQPGQRYTVEVGRGHQVANGSPSEPASYLLIQGVGRYDFNNIDSNLK